MPTGVQLGRAGYVSVPSFTSSNMDLANGYADGLITLIKNQDEGGACGWIVDLRENTGGSMLPMVAGLRPFLGDGPFMTLKYGDGTSQTWTYPMMVKEVESRYELRGFDPHDYVLRSLAAPVAVLTGFDTSSAGEGVALAFRGRPATRSFGADTQGLSTNNDGFDLPDGAMLILTTAVMADRNGEDFGGGPIRPDVLVKDGQESRTDVVLDEDPVVLQALMWLNSQDSCQEPKPDS